MSDHERASSPRVAVLDIDGVLADVRHRIHHIQARPRDWDAFFAEVSADPVLDEGRSEALAAAASGLALVYLTGRPERCRLDTVRWLEAHGLPEGDLVMRRDSDRRPAKVFKIQALRDLSRSCEVAYLLDDDPDVIAAADSAGYDVRLADWLPRDDAEADPLREAQETLGRT